MADKTKRKRKVHKRKHAKPAAPHVAIFFLIGKNLLVERTPVSAGEIYGDFRIHERGHDAYWEMLRNAGAVPQTHFWAQATRLPRR